MAGKATGERYSLELQALPWGVPATVRLKGALKLLRRGFGLRCIQLVEVPTVVVDELRPIGHMTADASGGTGDK